MEAASGGQSEGGVTRHQSGVIIIAVPIRMRVTFGIAIYFKNLFILPFALAGCAVTLCMILASICQMSALAWLLLSTVGLMRRILELPDEHRLRTESDPTDISPSVDGNPRGATPGPYQQAVNLEVKDVNAHQVSGPSFEHCDEVLQQNPWWETELMEAPVAPWDGPDAAEQETKTDEGDAAMGEREDEVATFKEDTPSETNATMSTLAAAAVPGPASTLVATAQEVFSRAVDTCRASGGSPKAVPAYSDETEAKPAGSILTSTAHDDKKLHASYTVKSAPPKPESPAQKQSRWLAMLNSSDPTEDSSQTSRSTAATGNPALRAEPSENFRPPSFTAAQLAEAKGFAKGATRGGTKSRSTPAPRTYGSAPLLARYVAPTPQPVATQPAVRIQYTDDNLPLHKRAARDRKAMADSIGSSSRMDATPLTTIGMPATRPGSTNMYDVLPVESTASTPIKSTPTKAPEPISTGATLQGSPAQIDSRLSGSIWAPKMQAVVDTAPACSAKPRQSSPPDDPAKPTSLRGSRQSAQSYVFSPPPVTHLAPRSMSIEALKALDPERQSLGDVARFDSASALPTNGKEADSAFKDAVSASASFKQNAAIELQKANVSDDKPSFSSKHESVALQSTADVLGTGAHHKESSSAQVVHTLNGGLSASGRQSCHGSSASQVGNDLLDLDDEQDWSASQSRAAYAHAPRRESTVSTLSATAPAFTSALPAGDHPFTREYKPNMSIPQSPPSGSHAPRMVSTPSKLSVTAPSFTLPTDSDPPAPRSVAKQAPEAAAASTKLVDVEVLASIASSPLSSLDSGKRTGTLLPQQGSTLVATSAQLNASHTAIQVCAQSRPHSMEVRNSIHGLPVFGPPRPPTVERGATVEPPTPSVSFSRLSRDSSSSADPFALPRTIHGLPGLPAIPTDAPAPASPQTDNCGDAVIAPSARDTGTNRRFSYTTTIESTSTGVSDARMKNPEADKEDERLEERASKLRMSASSERSLRSPERDPKFQARAKSPKKVAKQLKEAARIKLTGAWWVRERARRKVQGTWSLDTYQVFEAATVSYNRKREALQELMGGGQLNAEDAALFPVFSTEDLRKPARRPTALEPTHTENRNSPRGESKPESEGSSNGNEQENDSQRADHLRKAQTALERYDEAISYFKRPPPQGRHNLQALANAGKAKIAPAKNYYLKRRDEFVACYPDDPILNNPDLMLPEEHELETVCMEYHSNCKCGRAH
ncbi:hypothetical protein LTR53_000222 [Teratosphaeriaceae sp. CCFEE 6253]|nr:hypothetical protein LTR53_000222 [Teratosphaeriaceae sp. CCFEE 6253]